MSRLAIAYTPILLFLYVAEILICTFTFTAMSKVMVKRMNSGIVSAFMLSLWVLFFMIGLNVLSMLYSRILDIFHLRDGTWEALRWVFWTVSISGMTISLFFVGFLISSGRMHIYITSMRTKNKFDEEAALDDFSRSHKRPCNDCDNYTTTSSCDGCTGDRKNSKVK